MLWFSAFLMTPTVHAQPILQQTQFSAGVDQSISQTDLLELGKHLLQTINALGPKEEKQQIQPGFFSPRTN